MKIAIFVHCFFPEHFYGTETYTLNIAKYLQKVGHSVTIVSAVFPGEPSLSEAISAYLFSDLDVITIDKNFLPHRRVRDTYFQPDISVHLDSILTRLEPDIILVTHLINHTAVLLDLARDRRIPMVATMTDFFGFCFTNKLEDATGSLCRGPNRSRSNCMACYLKLAKSSLNKWPLVSFLRRRLPLGMFSRVLMLASHLHILRSKDLVHLIQDMQDRPKVLLDRYNRSYAMAIAPTQFLANAYRLNGFTMPTTVQWFGVDIDRTPKPVRSPDTPLRIGYIGQLAAHKGVDLLVEAFQSLQPCNAELLIYGSVNQDVTYSRHLKKLAQEKVSFLGTFEPTDMGRIMNELDILIIPSRWYENSPLVLLYALATHTPVIVSRVDGLTEFLDEGVNGYSFERGSIPELSKVLQRFIIDPSLASRLSRSTSYDRTTEDMATDLSKQLEVALRSK